MGSKLILVRHGQSTWNQKNLFTGWVDIPLSEKGIQEALSVGEQIKSIPVSRVYTSSLIRAQMTVMLALLHHTSGKVPCILHPENDWGTIHGKEAQEQSLPVYCDRALNERMYGQLQGLNKQETMARFGESQVHQWRRSFRSEPPQGESLAKTAERVLPYFKSVIMPAVQQGEDVLVVAHGNSLRAIVMFLEQLSEDAVTQLEIATGKALFYTWENQRWHAHG